MRGSRRAGELDARHSPAVSAASCACTRQKKKPSCIVVFGGGFLLLIVLWWLFAQITGIGPRSQFTIRVTGSPGTSFSGSYMVVNSNGGSTSRTVQSTVPENYTVSDASVVSVAFQKKEAGGTLTVELLRDGEMVKSGTTTADYGMVTLASR
jgi:hypothetical protein